MFNTIILLVLSNCFWTESQTQKQPSPAPDREAILAMAGTYEVSFRFEETASFLPDYQIKQPYTASALEIIVVDEENSNRIVLQHLLQTEHGIIKHWRQDWLYENRILWEFQGNQTWKKRELSEEEAAGTWTQRVFQVDDSPRYEAIGRWHHQGGVSQWTSTPTSRPLPRREYTKRDDYDILRAVNRHTLTSSGWIHEQDNDKLVSRTGPEYILAREWGLNSYVRTDATLGAEARQWWRDHRPFWLAVRKEWDSSFAFHVQIQIAEAVDDKSLDRHIFALDRAWAKNELDPNKGLPEHIQEVLTQFGIPQKGSASQ